MSDQETPEQVQETAPSQKWGDDEFNAEIARDLVDKLRAREKELEPNAKAFERLKSGEDQDAFRELAESYGFQIAEDDDEDEGDWEDPYAPKFKEYDEKLKKLEALEAAEEQRQIDAQATAFRDSVETLAKAKGYELQDYHVLGLLQDAMALGDLTDANIEKAFNTFAERLEAEYEKVVEQRRKQRKTAGNPPVSGDAASPVEDLKTRKDMAKYISQRMQGD